MRLGKTNLEVNKNGFGALPIQRRNKKDSIEILKRAYENKINFYDTARFYSDSEEKIGKALNEVRDKIIIATKTGSEKEEDFWKDLETSLKYLQTDYIDLYQFHNLPFCPKHDDGSNLYEAIIEAKSQGLIKHIGITTHKYTIAIEALNSGLYETLQYPFSYLSGKSEIELVEKCKKLDVGFIAMKAMGGGLIKNAKASYAYINQFSNILPIWGIQKEEELDEFLLYEKTKPRLDDKLKIAINKDKEELKENFCRGCGYCMPCPEEINISMCARMSLWIRRFPTEPYLTPKYQKIMEKTRECMECYLCVDNCPYELDIPKLLRENYNDYMNVLKNTK